MSSRLLVIVVGLVTWAQVASAQSTFVFKPSEWLFNPFDVGQSYKGLGGWYCAPVPGAEFTACNIFVYVGHPAWGEGPQTIGMCSYGFDSDVTFDGSGPDYWHGAGAGPCPPDEGAFCESIGNNFTRATGGGGTTVATCVRFD